MKKLSISMLSIIAGITTVLSLGLRIICLFFFYDKIGYYKAGAPLPIIANILFGISIAFFLTASIFSINKKQSVEAPAKASQYAAALPIGALVFHLIRILRPVVITSIEDIKNGVFSFSNINFSVYGTIISILVSVAFFFFIFISKKQFKTANFYLGLGALAYIFFCWMSSYFDAIIPINSTDKIFFYLGCAGAILFIFNEMCAIYGEVKSRFYYFSLFVAILTLSTSSISAIVGYSCNIFKSYISLEADVFFITLAIYAIIRLIEAQKSKIVIEETVEAASLDSTDNPCDTDSEESINDDCE